MNAPDSSLLELAATIRLLVLDVDGVLTDGSLYYNNDGEFMKAFHVHDGYGLRLLQRAGIDVAVISGRRSAATEHRLRELEINEIHLGIADKGPLLRSICDRLGIKHDQVAVVGDDQPDLPMLQMAGLAVAVSNAHPSILDSVQWVTSRRGGEGAVREVCDLLLAAEDTA